MTRPYPAHSPLFSPFWAMGFEALFLPLRKALLRSLLVMNKPKAIPEDRPLVLFGNHPGNWDGFLFREVQRRLRPKAGVFSVMLEKELRQRPLFRKIGGLGIDPGNAAAGARLLRDLVRLRQDQGSPVVSVFPQGRLQPSWIKPLGFQPGILAMARALAPATLLPIALHYQHLKGLTPTVFLHFGEPMPMQASGPALAAAALPAQAMTLASLEAAVAAPLQSLFDWITLHGEALEELWLGLPKAEIWKA